VASLEEINLLASEVWLDKRGVLWWEEPDKGWTLSVLIRAVPSLVEINLLASEVWLDKRCVLWWEEPDKGWTLSVIKKWPYKMGDFSSGGQFYKYVTI